MKIPLPAILNARPLPPPLPWKYESTRFEYKFLPINQFFTENMLLPGLYSCRFRYTETGFSCCLLMGRAVRKLGRLNSIKLGNFRIRAHSEESKMTYNGPLRPKAETSYPLYPSTWNKNFSPLSPPVLFERRVKNNGPLYYPTKLPLVHCATLCTQRRAEEKSTLIRG